MCLRTLHGQTFGLIFLVNVYQVLFNLHLSYYSLAMLNLRNDTKLQTKNTLNIYEIN